MGVTSKYVYGIVNSDAYSTSKDELTESAGDCEVYLVSYKDVAALVADTDVADYASLPKDVLARHLLKHQEVIEKVMRREATVIPMRLGTCAVDDNEVLRILQCGYDTIVNTFERMTGRVENDVVAAWSDLQSVLREIAEDDEIKELRIIAAGRKEGATIDDKVKVGFLVKKRLDMKREKYGQEIAERLADVSQGRKTHDCMDDPVIMNEAFLVNRRNQTGFLEKLEELARSYDEQLRFRCVGPLPAYSFCTLEVKKTDSQGARVGKKAPWPG